jgi:hypothetical protein
MSAQDPGIDVAKINDAKGRDVDVTKINDAKSLRTLMSNARRLGRKDVYWKAFGRLCARREFLTPIRCTASLHKLWQLMRNCLPRRMPEQLALRGHGKKSQIRGWRSRLRTGR